MAQPDYNRGHLELRYDADLHCICTRLKGGIERLQLREIHEQVLQWMQSHQTRKFLADFAELDTFDFEDQTWFIRHWLPIATRGKDSKVAIILPAGVISYLNVAEGYTDRKTGQPLIKICKRLSDAQRWLQNAGDSDSAEMGPADD